MGFTRIPILVKLVSQITFCKTTSAFMYLLCNVKVYKIPMEPLAALLVYSITKFQQTLTKTYVHNMGILLATAPLMINKETAVFAIKIIIWT